MAEVAKDKEIYVILDNYATHKKNHDWLAMHPNVYFHFTPTSASWLNQVEIWFGILGRKASERREFPNHRATDRTPSKHSSTVHNKTPFPLFGESVRYKGSQLRNTIVNLRN